MATLDLDREPLTLAEKVEHILEPSLAHEGYAIVRVQVSGNVRKVLQLMIERQDGEDVTIDDCVKVSRYSSTLLDVDDPFPFAYVLEVSSPGLDRPLVKPKDYVRFSGHDIKINLTEPIHNRKRFIAHLNHANDATINLTVISDASDAEALTFDVPYHQINNAKLYINFDHFLNKKGKPSGKPKN